MIEKSYFVLTLPLRTEKWQEDVLNKSFEVNREIYNALLGGGLRRYAQMVQTRRYRALIQKLDTTMGVKERKAVYKELDAMQAEYRLRRFDFSNDSTKYRQYFKENTDAPIVQNIAVNVWKAMYALISREANAVHRKEPGQLNALEGKTNKTSIRYQDGIVLWKKLRIPVLLKGNVYEREALSQEIRYCRVKRKWLRGKYHYYVDLILKGKCPVKRRIPMKASEAGAVGIDVQMKQLTLVSDSEIRILELPKKSGLLEKQRKKLAAKMERSRRVNHPENYLPDGRMKKGSSKWEFSKKYAACREAYRELGRLQKIYQKEAWQSVIREILPLGQTFYVEKLDYKNIRRRDGRVRLGGTIERTALAAFLQELQWKMMQNNRRLVYIDPVKAAVGSKNHITNRKEKISHKNNFREIGGYLLDKHIYSAFLMKFADETTGEIKVEECREAFGHFLDLYESSPYGLEANAG